jgi:O-antigen ligase
VGLVSLIGVLIYGYQFFLQNEYLISRFEQLDEGNSSGRDEIFAYIFSNWANSESLFDIFFGYGFAGSRQLSGKGLAHNDWLELLSNFGLLGVVIYLLFFYQAFKYAIKLNVQSQYRLMLLCILTIWLATSLFSMGYNSSDGYLRSILLGYILGISNPKRSVSNNHIYTSQRTPLNKPFNRQAAFS